MDRLQLRSLSIWEQQIGDGLLVNRATNEAEASELRFTIGGQILDEKQRQQQWELEGQLVMGAEAAIEVIDDNQVTITITGTLRPFKGVTSCQPTHIRAKVHRIVA